MHHETAFYGQRRWVCDVLGRLVCNDEYENFSDMLCAVSSSVLQICMKGKVVKLMGTVGFAVVNTISALHICIMHWHKV